MFMNNTDLLYAMSLKSVPQIGDSLAKSIYHFFDHPKKAFTSSLSQLKKIPGLGDKAAMALKNFSQFQLIENEILKCNRHGIDILLFDQNNYPYRLKDCNDSPFFLFMKGQADLNHTHVLSVVGTRKSSDYGVGFCRQLAHALQGTNTLIVSGLAYGIDSAIHKACLEYHIPTTAVMAHGLKHISPQLNKPLSDHMLRQPGNALLSEHFFDESPNPEYFPKRNRIVAGMCDAIVIVESGIRGGAMITAELAWGYNRELFALPGRISDVYSKGCNLLISNNRAMCIQSPGHLLEYLGWKQPSQSQPPFTIPEHLHDDQKKVCLQLRSGSQTIDQIHQSTGISFSSLSIALLELEFMGIIRSLPGKSFSLTH
jgi:DNA processing protein